MQCQYCLVSHYLEVDNVSTIYALSAILQITTGGNADIFLVRTVIDNFSCTLPFYKNQINALRREGF